MTKLAGAQTALIVVHLQNDIIAPGTAFGDLFHSEVVAKDVITRCCAAADTVRAAGGQVFALKIAYAEDNSNLNPSMPLLQLVAQTECLKETDKGSAIVAEFAHDPDEEFVHTRPGPFTDSDLDARLKAAGITSVVVCGVATNASVEGTVRQAADLGYDTYVLTDACSASDHTTHEASLTSMTTLFAAGLTVSELASAMR